MLGMVFTNLVEMVEERLSPDLADDILEAANLGHGGAYTAVGYYPFEEMQKLVSLLSERTEIPAEVLLEQFGEYLFGGLAEGHGELLTNKGSLFELLASLDSQIHTEVLKLYPEAQLPRFSVHSRSDSTLVLDYVSVRNLTPLAKGLINGAASHYNAQVEVTIEPLPETQNASRISVHRLDH